MSRRTSLHLIYDGDCGFCVRSLKVLQRLDVLGRLRYWNARERAAVLLEFPALATADLDDAMYAVTEDGRAYRGFFAFRRAVWVSPLMWWLLPLFYFPGAGVIGPRVYAWVARNRRSLGCNSDVCELPTKRDS